MIAIVIMTGVDMAMGINTPKLNVPSSFRVSSQRFPLQGTFNKLGEK